MLNLGFFEEVTRILDHLPKDRQQLLFSAPRCPRTSSSSSHDYPTDPETILLSGDVFTVEHIHNVRYTVGRRVPEAAQPHLHARDGGAGERHRLLQHPGRHRAGDGGAEPQRLRRGAAQRRPAAEGARAGDGAR